MMKLEIELEWWEGNKQYKHRLIEFDLGELTMMMKYGSEYRDRIELEPLDVSAINSPLKITLKKVCA